MKKLVILSAIAVSGLIYHTADAQISIHFGFGFHPHPVYCPTPAPVVVEQAPVYEEPAPVYDNNGDDDYYYLPDVDAYYNVNEQCYYYNDGAEWISAAYLPGDYCNYDWRNATRYEIRAPRPYMHNDFYRSRFNGHPFNGWAHANYDQHFNAGNSYRDHFNHDGFRGRDEHFDNRGQYGYSHPAGPVREGGQRFEDRGRGGYGQPSFSNGNPRDYHTVSQRIEPNSPRGGFTDRRMARF